MLVAVVTSNAAVRAAVPWLVPGVDARYLDPGDPGTLPTDTDVVVVDVGSTDDGIALVEHLRGDEAVGHSTPAIVIGDELAEVTGDTDVIIRPVDLEDLRLRLELLRPATELPPTPEHEPVSGLTRLWRKVGMRGRSDVGQPDAPAETPPSLDPAGPSTRMSDRPGMGASASAGAVESPAGSDGSAAAEPARSTAVGDGLAAEQGPAVEASAARGEEAWEEADERAPEHLGTDLARDVQTSRTAAERERPSDTAGEADESLSPADVERRPVGPHRSEVPPGHADEMEQPDTADAGRSGSYQRATAGPQGVLPRPAPEDQPAPPNTVDETRPAGSPVEVSGSADAPGEGQAPGPSSRVDAPVLGGAPADDVPAEDLPDEAVNLEVDAPDRMAPASPESVARDAETPPRSEGTPARRGRTSLAASLVAWLRSVRPERSRGGTSLPSRVEELLDQVEELPALRDPRAVGRAIASELRDRGAAGPIAILLRDSEGFRTIGGLDLTGAQTRAVVPADHPLVDLLEQRAGSLLLLEGLHGGTALVRGVPVAHADTTTVIPVHDDDGLMAIAIIGGLGGRPPQLIAAMGEARDYLTVLMVVGAASAGPR